MGAYDTITPENFHYEIASSITDYTQACYVPLTDGLVGKFSSSLDSLAYMLQTAHNTAGGMCLKPYISMDAPWCFDFRPGGVPWCGDLSRVPPRRV